jgi:hypothetical protein
VPTDKAAQGTASQTEDETVDQTQETKEPSREKPANPRDAIFARIDALREQGLEKDGDYALRTGHPMAVQVEAERRAKNAAEPPAESKPAVVQEEPVAAAAEDPQGSDDTEVVANPLEAHGIVLKDGKPALKLKVDGKESLVPLDTARATLQKHTAAEVRLQQAAEQRRQNDEYANRLAAKEAELNARSVKSQPSAPAAVDDQGLKDEAKALVSSLLTDSEDVAAEKLAKVLAKTRQAATPPVNVEEVAAKAAQAVETRLADRDAKKDQAQGYQQFKSQYPDIESNPELFTIADSKTDAISKEHPEWNPSQVMLEAGRQTKEWLAALAGTAPVRTPSSPTNDRQARKDNLRPMPPTRSARVAATKEGPVVETPADIVASMRKARGQG